MPMGFTPPILITSAIVGALSAYVAHRRGLNPYAWFALGFLFGIFGVFAIFFAGKSKPQTPPVAVEPTFIIDGPSDKFWYYLDPQNERQGPMSREAITHAWKSGKVNLATYVWHEELAEWKPLKNCLKEAY